MILFASVGKSEETISFRRQVQPILSDKCFHCHGPDADNQDSEFRADTEESLFEDLGDYAAVVPGSLEKSELHKRIHSKDEFVQMPPPDSNRSLTGEDRRILDLWIQQGAPYEGHWAFERITKPEVPPIDRAANRLSGWTANPIDAFVSKRLAEAKLKPSPEADPLTLLRRASLTLTGLLPAEELQNRFLNNPTDAGYREVLDELLNSINYAERQSLRWMDAARYADTDGYQNDSHRTNWPWRDWVTKAFHDNMPFDEFTIQQIAGDMLPDATLSQKLGSAFNRNHRQNAEGGALADEFFIENVIDRVETTSTVWLGLTFGCARCHDHKYDPLSQKEFYQLFAYFNNIGERGTGKGIQANPTLSTWSPLRDVSEELLIALKTATSEQQEAKKTIGTRMKAWLDELKSKADSTEWLPIRVTEIDVNGDGELKQVDDHTLKYFGSSNSPLAYRVELQSPVDLATAIRIVALPDSEFTKPRQLSRSVNGNFVLCDVQLMLNGVTISIEHVSATFAQANYPATNIIDDDPRSGWAVFGGNQGASRVNATLYPAAPLSLRETDTLELQLSFSNQYANHNIGKFRVLVTDTPTEEIQNSSGLPDQVAAAVAKPADKRTKEENKQLRDYYETIDKRLAKANAAVKAADQALTAQSGPRATVMVMQERHGVPTPAYLLNRGQYDAPDESEVLTRAVPKALLSSPKANQPKDRLELARWLVSPNNPLTARVFVNRVWQDHFGIGLVKTAEDFGVQGEVPSHPELLDWLAAEFIESDWNIKALHRLIVTSATYRQSSRTSSDLLDVDPDNRLLARGPRYRADGFTIRDVALQASGLLNKTVGGASVKPYQPAGLWASMASGARTKYDQGRGNDLYRKSMYTYWKRAVNPPRQTIFDASGREVCNVRVRRTNTPLQALVLMNDPTMVEAARKLAERTLQLPDANLANKLEHMYRLAMARQLDAKTMRVLQRNLEFFKRHFTDNPADGEQLLSIGESTRDKTLPTSEHAAMTATAHLILNLDEFVTIE